MTYWALVTTLWASWQRQHFFLLYSFHLFDACLPDLSRRYVKVLDKLVLHRPDFFVLNSAHTKSNLWLGLLASRRWLHIIWKKAWLFENVAKVDQSVVRENLIHVVDTRTKLKVRWHVLNSVTWFLSANHVVFISLGLLMSEFTFNHVGERVRNLGLGGKDTSDKSCTWYVNGVNWAKVGRIEAVVNKRLDIELKVEPDTLKDHTTGYSGVQRLPWDVVFWVCVLSATEEDQPLLLLHLVWKDDLDVKLLLVQHFNLKTEIRLEQVQFRLSRFFRKR